MVSKKENKIIKIWDKLSNTSKKLTILVTIVSSVIFLYPIANSKYKIGKEYIEFLSRGIELKNKLDNLEEYHIVLSSILRANMEKVEYDGHTKYGVYLNNELVEVKLRKSKTGDIFVFVNDGKAGAYSVRFNNDEHKFSYIDFEGKHHFIQFLN